VLSRNGSVGVQVVGPPFRAPFARLAYGSGTHGNDAQVFAFADMAKSSHGEPHGELFTEGEDEPVECPGIDRLIRRIRCQAPRPGHCRTFALNERRPRVVAGRSRAVTDVAAAVRSVGGGGGPLDARRNLA
jgi:hypothetical protein